MPEKDPPPGEPRRREPPLPQQDPEVEPGIQDPPAHDPNHPGPPKIIA